MNKTTPQHFSKSKKINLEEETISYIKSLEQKIQKQAFRLSESENYKLQLETLIKQLENNQCFPLQQADYQNVSKKISLLNKAYSQYEHLRNDLEKVLNQKKKMQLESSEEIEKLYSENKRLLSENTRLKIELDNVNNNVNDMKMIKKELKNSSDLNTMEKSKLKLIVNSLEQENLSLQTKYKLCNEENDRILSEKEMINNRLVGLEHMIHDSNEKFNQLLNEKNVLEREFEINIDELNYKKDELFCVKNEKESLLKENRNLKDEVMALEEKVNVLSVTIKEKEKEICGLKEKIMFGYCDTENENSLIKRNTNSKSNNMDKDNTDTNNSNSNNKNDNNKNNLTFNNNNKKPTYSNFDDLNAENEENLNIIKQQKSSLCFYKSKIESIEKELLKMTSRNKALEADIDNIDYQLKKALQDKEKLISSFNQRDNTRTEQLRHLESELKRIKDLENENSQNKKEITTVSEEVEFYKQKNIKDNRVKDAEIASLYEQIEQINSEREKLLNKVSELNKKLESMINENYDNEEKIKENNDNFDKLSSDFVALKCILNEECDKNNSNDKKLKESSDLNNELIEKNKCLERVKNELEDHINKIIELSEESDAEFVELKRLFDDKLSSIFGLIDSSIERIMDGYGFGISNVNNNRNNFNDSSYKYTYGNNEILDIEQENSLIHRNKENNYLNNNNSVNNSNVENTFTEKTNKFISNYYKQKQQIYNSIKNSKFKDMLDFLETIVEVLFSELTNQLSLNNANNQSVNQLLKENQEIKDALQQTTITLEESLSKYNRLKEFLKQANEELKLTKTENSLLTRDNDCFLNENKAIKQELLGFNDKLDSLSQIVKEKNDNLNEIHIRNDYLEGYIEVVLNSRKYLETISYSVIRKHNNNGLVTILNEYITLTDSLYKYEKEKIKIQNKLKKLFFTNIGNNPNDINCNNNYDNIELEKCLNNEKDTLSELIRDYTKKIYEKKENIRIKEKEIEKILNKSSSNCNKINHKNDNNLNNSLIRSINNYSKNYGNSNNNNSFNLDQSINNNTNNEFKLNTNDLIENHNKNISYENLARESQSHRNFNKFGTNNASQDISLIESNFLNNLNNNTYTAGNHLKRNQTQSKYSDLEFFTQKIN